MLQSFPRDASTGDIMAALERDGGAVVEGLLDEQTLDGLNRDLAPHLEREAWGNTEPDHSDEFFGLKTKRLHGLLARSPLFGEIILEPLLLAMCDHFLKPRCRHYRISTGELMALGRGQKPQQLHRDADSWHYFPNQRPEILVSANFALTDFSQENGATVVVPGSHRWPADRAVSDADPRAAAVMRRGSALLYSGNVLHGGGANQTDEVRIGLYVGYLLSWLRPIENHLITNGSKAVRAAPAMAQRLLDYTETGWHVVA